MQDENSKYFAFFEEVQLMRVVVPSNYFLPTVKKDCAM
jgi:hypothetical protein